MLIGSAEIDKRIGTSYVNTSHVLYMDNIKAQQQGEHENMHVFLTAIGVIMFVRCFYRTALSYFTPGKFSFQLARSDPSP